MQRHALLIANGTYTNSNLRDLPGPALDAKRLHQVLINPCFCGFENRDDSLLIDGDSHVVAEQLNRFLIDAAEDDLLLLYYSGHGLLDLDDNLYLAARNSDPHLGATMISFPNIRNWIHQSRCRRIVVLLDCCYGGAAGVSISKSADTPEAAFQQFAEGTGVYLLTACNRYEKAQDIIGEGGLFTGYVAEALETGGGVGAGAPVSIDQVHVYVSKKLKDDKRCRQSANLFAYQKEGDTVLVATGNPNDQHRLAGSSGVAVTREARWKLVPRAYRRVLDVMGPAYLLDSQYHFIDWNPAFDLFAEELGVRRGEHVADRFLSKLANWTAVHDRAQKVFPPDRLPPLADVEAQHDAFILSSDKYGKVAMNKIATQLPTEEAMASAWLVCLDVDTNGSAGRYWEDLTAVVTRTVNWTRYALTYDRVIGNFGEYQKLEERAVRLVCENVRPNGHPGGLRLLDLGAGTGNSTVRLLREYEEGTIDAVDNNAAMLLRLEDKLNEKDRSRVHIFKSDALSWLRETAGGTYDAAIMVNVLFALPNPVECLREIWRILRFGAPLVLSTSHHDTDIHRLFRDMKADLLSQNVMPPEDVERFWEDAYARNREMETSICRDAKEDIRSYLEQAHFEVRSWIDPEYVDCVVLVCAVKH